MADCTFCKRDLNLESDNGRDNGVCVEEYHRQSNVGACLSYGTTPPDGAHHDERADYVNNRKMRNYPRPQ